MNLAVQLSMTFIREPFATGSFYHIFNQSIAKEKIFVSGQNLRFALNIVDYYRYSQTIRFSKFRSLPYQQQFDYLTYIKRELPLIEIYTFSFMPNHYHFQLRQLKENGVKNFMSNVQNSFAKVYNIKKDRTGSLFRDCFKAKKITSNEEFIHISRYIHLNPVTSSLINFEELSIYPYTSFQWYVNPKLNRFVSSSIILDHFKSVDKYRKFLRDQVGYQKSLHRIKHLIEDTRRVANNAY